MSHADVLTGMFLTGADVELRGLHEVYLGENRELRITKNGLRMSRHEKWGERRAVPGGKAACSCCGALVSAVTDWQSLQICDSCLEESDGKRP